MQMGKYSKVSPRQSFGWDQKRVFYVLEPEFICLAESNGRALSDAARQREVMNKVMLLPHVSQQLLKSVVGVYYKKVQI